MPLLLSLLLFLLSAGVSTACCCVESDVENDAESDDDGMATMLSRLSIINSFQFLFTSVYGGRSLEMTRLRKEKEQIERARAGAPPN